jgi:dTDP-4-dehydrorhamnose reductase
MSTRSIYLLGAGGFIGQTLLSTLAGELVLPIFSSSGPDRRLALDLRTPGDFDYGAVNGGDVVIFAAAISSPDRCASEFALAYDVNVRGTGTAMEMFVKRGARILFLSSDVVFGERADEAFEDADLRPLGPYAEMKAEIERRFHADTRVVPVRLSYVVSEHDKYLRYLHGCAESGTTAKVFSALNRRAVFVGDVADAVAALVRGGEVRGAGLNVGGPELLSRYDIALRYKEAVRPDLKVEVVEPPPDFFLSRPRTINMGSRYLPTTLGHVPTTIAHAMKSFRNQDLSHV